MMICAKCGNELSGDANFCANCGAQIVVEPVVETVPIATPVQAGPVTTNLSSEDNEFIENTRHLLRWEQKAWKITGIVFAIMGGLFGGLFLLFAIIFLAVGDEMAVMGVVYFVYALIYGTMFLGLGIVQLVAAKKIPRYLNTIDNEFEATAKRCGSVGMIVFSAFFGYVPLVFFVINFARMKSCSKTVKHIIAFQKER